MTTLYSRREFGRVALAAVPLALALNRIQSKINGVQIGLQTYSFRSLPRAEEVIQAMVQIGLDSAELMSGHAEALAGAPALVRGSGSRGQSATPEETELIRVRTKELHDWRFSASSEVFKAVRKKFDAAGIDVRLLYYGWNRNTPDAEIEYAFQMAKALGVRAISTSTQVSVAKRIAPFANSHRLMVGFHNHSNLTDPEEVASIESFDRCMSFSKYHGVNLDIGHFTAANLDPVSYLRRIHGRTTNIHLKDRKRNQGANVPWGEGDTPIKPVLQLLSRNKWDIPANIEFEYPGDSITEVTKCFQYCKAALAASE